MYEQKSYLDINFKTLDVNDEYVDIEGYATVAVPDRDDEIVDISGLDLSNYMKNPIILYQHDKNRPIGKALEVRPEHNVLYIKARIFKDMNKEAYVGVKNGVLKSFSIGFRVFDGEFDENLNVYVFKRSELFEVSVVSIPANPEAIFRVIKDIDGKCKGVCMLKNQKLKIVNDEFSLTPWAEVDKTTLHNMLKNIGDKKLIDEAYLYVENYENVSTWCCPHHEIKGDKLIPNKNGIIAAYQALKGAHGQKPNIPQDAYQKAIVHIKKHYRKMYELGIIDDLPEEFKMVKSIDNVGLNLDNLLDEISKETGLDKKVITKILLFLNFSVFKEDGTLTKFASTYNITKDKAYEDLYNVLKEIKAKYKSDKEYEAFGVMLKDLSLSTVSRASAWIYKTYIVRQANINDNEKLLTSRTFAESWFFNSLGLSLDNLLKFKKVVIVMDKYKDVVAQFVSEQNYTKSNRKDSNVEAIEKRIDELTLLVKELKDKVEQKEQKFDVISYFKNLGVDDALKLYDEIAKVVNKKIEENL